MYEIQSNAERYDRPAELSFSTLQQTVESQVNHSGRDVAVMFQPAVLPLVPPPSYSELVHTPPPSYREVMGLEYDIESAEMPSTPVDHEAEAPHYMLTGLEPWPLRRCVIVVSTPFLALLIGACFWYLVKTTGSSPP